MSYLLKNVKIIDSNSAFHLENKDILIEKGTILKISKSIPKADHKIIEGKNLCVSVGFTDMNCHIYQPGFEYREDMNSGLKAAVNGGFTTVA